MRCFALPLLVLLLAACGGGAAPRTLATGAPPLVLDAVAPASGPRSGGPLVELRGSGFETGNPSWPVFVRFGDVAALGTVVSDTVVRALLPPRRTPGRVDVELVHGVHRAILAEAFDYLPDPPPVVAFPLDVAPVSGGRDATRITIEGGPFSASPSLRWGGLALAPEHVLSVRPDRIVVAPPVEPRQVGRGARLELDDGDIHAGFDVRVVAPLSAGDVFVNELLPNPGEIDANGDGTESTAGDEFVEIVNARSDAVDLTGVAILDASSVRHVCPNPTTIPAGGALVVFGSGTPMGFAPTHASGHAQLATSGALGLNNGSDEVRLLDADGTELFAVVYGSSSAGSSLRAATDGVAPPLSASDPDYVADSPSPGRRAGDAPFP